MNYTFRIKDRVFYIGTRLTCKVKGVNSDLGDNQHFLMWDYDDTEKDKMMSELATIQKRYQLPPVYVMRSNPERGYHAYCFKSVTWSECKQILTASDGIDKKYLAIGILRGFFTLRYSPCGDEEITLEDSLPSIYPEDVNPLEFTSFSTYTKKRRA